MDHTTQKTILSTRRALIMADLAAIEDALDDTPTKDLEDVSTERQGDEVLEARGTLEAAELKRIDLALARIDAGTYGICLNCGDPISDARLAVVPDAALCKSCAH